MTSLSPQVPGAAGKNEIRGYFPVIGFIPGSAPPKIPASRFLGEGYNRLIENGYWR
jgi:hypothetical protein